MNNRTKYLAAGGAALVLLGAFSIWFFLFRDTAPEAVSLGGAIESVTSTTSPDSTATSAPPEGLDGMWVIDSAVGAGVVEDSSFVGYRVQEELATVGAKTAVGRTTAVTGTFQFSETTLTAADIVADLTQLRSDSTSRDSQMRTQALETDEFPEASFALAAPVDLGAVPGPGGSFAAEAIGDLTIHGVTRNVTVPIEGTLIGDTVVVVGSIEIVMADYDIDRPRAAIVLSVEDRGEMEFQLFLRRA